MPGVGNVGDFQKTFFVGESAEVSEVQKHRTSLGKSTEVLPQKYGGFMQRSPMFSEWDENDHDNKDNVFVRPYEQKPNKFGFCHGEN